MRKSTAPKPPSFAALVQQFFTEYLVAQRAVSPRTVACYRDALMLFLDFAGRRDVASLHDVERALAVPMKRFERPMLGFLTQPEMVAVLGQPEASWSSQRDHLLLAMLYNTGARVSEIV